MSEMRLIDANALQRKTVKVETAVEFNGRKRTCYFDNNVVPVEDIENTPTIDAMPVVRCKDCVHYKPKDAMTPGDNRMRCDHPCLDYDIECYDMWLDVEPNDYCKYGEKKMDGGAQE